MGVIAWLLANKWTRWLGLAIIVIAGYFGWRYHIRKQALDEEKARQNAQVIKNVETVEEVHRRTEGQSDDEVKEGLKKWAR